MKVGLPTRAPGGEEGEQIGCADGAVDVEVGGEHLLVGRSHECDFPVTSSPPGDQRLALR